MQHSGYVDSVPKYRKQDFDLHEYVFNRFSSVNIGELFIEGENYLLDYDCVIIGTNATRAMVMCIVFSVMKLTNQF